MPTITLTQKEPLPLVSIVVPNYNHARFLERRLTSIYNQTFQDFEVILLDDLSTDGSVDILKNFAEKYCGNTTLQLNDKNSGSGYLQWEKGITLAKGRYVWIAESDDYCESTFLETLVPLLESDDKVSLAFCQTVCVNEGGERLWRTNQRNIVQTYDGEYFFINKIMKRLFIPNASMVLFRKSSLTKHETTFESFRFSTDVLIWGLLATSGNVIGHGKHLNYFVRHDSATTGTVGSQKKASSDVLAIIEWFLNHSSLNNSIKSKLQIVWVGKKIDANFSLQDIFKEVFRKKYIYPANFFIGYVSWYINKLNIRIKHFYKAHLLNNNA